MPIQRYGAVCEHHDWRGVKRPREGNAELDAREHREEHGRPGCRFVGVEEQ